MLTNGNPVFLFAVSFPMVYYSTNFRIKTPRVIIRGLGRRRDGTLSLSRGVFLFGWSIWSPHKLGSRMGDVDYRLLWWGQIIWVALRFLIRWWKKLNILAKALFPTGGILWIQVFSWENMTKAFRKDLFARFESSKWLCGAIAISPYLSESTENYAKKLRVFVPWQWHCNPLELALNGGWMCL